ncbi:hypothetical protein ABMA28_008228 [Loxostege sticticalis]|uniref:MULE transposase domain-containing protein n=1 Tax=Loxostege sticticalis TaxID=481309 RepID=A0ABD0SGE3_LOXSC
MNSEPSTSRGNKLTIIPSQRGGQILLCNGYKYNLRGINNGHTTWRCVMRKCCSAKLVVNYNSIIIKEEPHTFPSFNNIKKTLYKHRNKSLETEKVRFLKWKEVCVPGKFKNLLFADYSDETRILIFCSEEGREQLYTIHVDLGSSDDDNMNIIPTVYALLLDKKQATYETLFRLLKSQVPEFEPQKVTTDFEISAMLAVNEVFPTAKTQGCLFHFKQAVLRKAKSHDLNKSKLGKAHVRRCMALSYLPTEFVSDGWLYVLVLFYNSVKYILMLNIIHIVLNITFYFKNICLCYP